MSSRKSKYTKTPRKTKSIRELLNATSSPVQEEVIVETEGEVMAEDENDRLGVNDFLGRQSMGYQSGIKVPEFQANNFEIKPTMLKMLETVSGCCDSFKQNGVPSDAVRLILFHYSLQGKAKEWVNNLEGDDVTSWDVLEKKFISRFFPHNKMVDARAALTNFSQQYGEHLYEAWERFKSLVRQSPGHNMEKWVLIQIFSTRLTPESKSELNVVTNGGITKQPVNRVWTCLDELSADFIQNTLKGG